jgi:hypothetical protein
MCREHLLGTCIRRAGVRLTDWWLSCLQEDPSGQSEFTRLFQRHTEINFAVASTTNFSVSGYFKATVSLSLMSKVFSGSKPASK